MFSSKIFKHFYIIFLIISSFILLNYISSIGFIDKNIIFTLITILALSFIIPTVAMRDDYSLYILNNSMNSLISNTVAFISIFLITLFTYYIKKRYKLNDSKSLKTLYFFYFMYMVVIFSISGWKLFKP